MENHPVRVFASWMDCPEHRCLPKHRHALVLYLRHSVLAKFFPLRRDTFFLQQLFRAVPRFSTGHLHYTVHIGNHLFSLRLPSRRAVFHIHVAIMVHFNAFHAKRRTRIRLRHISFAFISGNPLPLDFLPRIAQAKQPFLL